MSTRAMLPILATLWLGSAVAADFDAGMAAYRAGDYQQAHDQWLPLAEAGSAHAQFNLGLLYRYAKGREADPQQAAEWFLAAAESGLAAAQYELAEIYEAGEGIERDVVEAHKWFKLAGEQKYDDAKKRRKRLASRMTSSEIALAEMWAREWKKTQKARAD
ncbi:MAG TPA: tetratricopeptide repeat protein [Candidatus Polarisedimenticolaceae bacterium]|nr:tetratricopeptide repeat protein [Candidatus Polarisedimenticolaceae bacterium]